jgi:Mn-dependent DtxR family transcriptional regulator
LTPAAGLSSVATIMSSKPAHVRAPRNSVAVEDYLERILELINTKGYARVVDIAQSLKISQASVTNMVQRLDAEGLLKYEKYRGLVLTASGEALAKNIAQRHQLLTDFFKLLGLDDETIYHDVEGMEHHISPPTLRAIEILTAHLERQPALLAKVRKDADER